MQACPGPATGLTPRRLCLDGSLFTQPAQLHEALAQLHDRRPRLRPLVLLGEALVAPHRALLESMGLEDELPVLEVARDLGSLPPGTPPPLELRPLFDNVGDALPVIATTLACRPEFDGQDSGDVLASLMEQASEAPYASHWTLAYCQDGQADAQPCGLVLPSLLADGTLMGLGVAPWARGRGIGRALHRHALSQLRAMGARRYVDHIDRASVPMRRICVGHGCQVVRELRQFRLRLNAA